MPKRRQDHRTEAQRSDHDPHDYANDRDGVAQVKEQRARDESDQRTLQERHAQLPAESLPGVTIDGDFSDDEERRKSADHKRQHDDSDERNDQQQHEQQREESHQQTNQQRAPWLLIENGNGCGNG